ncbi:GNAT family N-acetyltransferase [Actinopolymorpha alba]|uniref:GNAT family N-acetyltransferase n=1 Tax=Actinopolymorpha alba TaxID=533267 RepID=UPI00037BE82D|nr:GNAT family N-acetyltransferase [Actinopolymorpha alba]
MSIETTGTTTGTPARSTGTPATAGSASTIRRVHGEELLTTALPLQSYAFIRSPHPVEAEERWRRSLHYHERNTILVAFGDEVAEATVEGLPMRQNVRGRTVGMLGVSGVATHPMARRRGHIRALLTQLHGEMRDAGHAVSTLYPFRQSFYERFGYVGFPKARRIRLFPAGLDRVVRADVPGEVTFHRIGEVYDDYSGFVERLLGERHGFSVSPPESAAQLRDDNDHWVVFARQEGEITGALLYRTTGFGQDLEGAALLSRGHIARTLLLQWLGRHLDQFSAFTFELPPDERPDLWYVDVHYAEETKVASPTHSAPMGRVLSVEGLAGIGAGPSRVTVEVVDDPFVGGIWTLDGSSGSLEVRRGGTPTATLTSHGLAALVYGVLDPEELVLQGYAVAEPESRTALATLFPPAAPYLFSSF